MTSQKMSCHSVRSVRSDLLRSFNCQDIHQGGQETTRELVQWIADRYWELVIDRGTEWSLICSGYDKMDSVELIAR